MVSIFWKLDKIRCNLAWTSSKSAIIYSTYTWSAELLKERRLGKKMREKEKRSLMNIIDLKVKEVKKKLKRVENRKRDYA
jgi:hypothetical protein